MIESFEIFSVGSKFRSLIRPTVRMAVSALLLAASHAPLQGASVYVDASKVVARVPEKMFGANLLQEKDVPLDDAYLAKIKHLGVTLLRYPGGFVEREEFYNWRYSDYNATDYEKFQSGQIDKATLNAGGSGRTGIGAFLAFTKRANVEPSLIVSTLRFVQDPKKGVAEAAAMVRAVNIEKKYGDHFVKIWEVGNERYEDVEGYAKEAKEYVRAMKAVDPRIQVFVMGGKRNRPEDAISMRPHLRNERFDGIVIHTFVVKNPQEVAQEIKAIRSGWPSDKTVFMSAWNSASPKGLSGLEQGEEMIYIMDGFLRAGATMAAVWPVQNHTENSLTNIRGSAIYPAGETFAWMSRYGKGGDYVETKTSGIFACSYVQGNRLTVFFCGGNFPTRPVSLDVQGFRFDPGVAAAEAMYASGSTSAREAPRFRKVQPVLSGDKITFNINESSRHEVIRLTLTRSGGR